MKTLVVSVVLLSLAHHGLCQVRTQYEDPCKRRGGTSPHEEYCDKFYECVGDNEVIVSDCPNGLVYTGRKSLVDVCGYDHEYDCGDRQQRSAAQRLAGSQEQLNACQEKDGIAPHKDYCDRFFECDGGQAYEVDCPNGLVYTGKRGLLDHCDYPSENPSACRNKELANPPISTEHCDWLYGIFGHETSCTRYWTCWNGTATEQFCIGGLLYNEQSHACDWPQDVEDCQKHPLCVQDPNGNVPLGKSCERYWSCQGGYPRLMRCPATLVFDKRSHSCVKPPTDDCDVPPTEEPYVEEEQQQPQKPQPNRSRRPIQPAPQALDVQQPDGDYIYYDEVEEPQFQPGRPPLPAGATRVN